MALKGAVRTSKAVRVFMSYSSDDKRLAGRIKRELTDWGLKPFLAHDDIQAGTEWGNELREELKECDVLVALLTAGFYESDWTDQEVGFAIALCKLVIPVRTERAPHGFMAPTQAVALKTADVSGTCERIVKCIYRLAGVRERFLDGLIRRLRSSDSFDEATRIAERLLLFSDYTPPQVEKAVRTATENNQVYGSRYAGPMMRKFMEEHADDVPDDLIRRAKKLLGSR